MSRPWIGVASVKVTPQVAQYYRLPVAAGGALVAGVEPYSPADDAGLRRGDIIEEIDGKRVDDPAEVAAHVRGKKPGSKVTVTVNRYGRQFQAGVEVDERP